MKCELCNYNDFCKLLTIEADSNSCKNVKTEMKKREDYIEKVLKENEKL